MKLVLLVFFLFSLNAYGVRPVTDPIMGELWSQRKELRGLWDFLQIAVCHRNCAFSISISINMNVLFFMVAVPLLRFGFYYWLDTTHTSVVLCVDCWEWGMYRLSQCACNQLLHSGGRFFTIRHKYQWNNYIFRYLVSCKFLSWICFIYWQMECEEFIWTRTNFDCVFSHSFWNFAPRR